MKDQGNKVIEIVGRIEQVDSSPCKKKLQKIIYLIEQAGLDLGFEYGIHFYGPYSADLDDIIHTLASENKIEIKCDHNGHIISTLVNETTLKSHAIIDIVVNTFGIKKPSYLELLATTLFVSRNISDNTINNVLYGVKKIKGSKYSDDKILDAIEQINKFESFRTLIQ